MSEWKVPVQSLIDHIKTATDVDPWAKGMAEELLKEQEAKKVIESTNMYTGLPITHCPKCGVPIDRYLYGRQHDGQTNYCPYCGQAVKWNEEVKWENVLSKPDRSDTDSYAESDRR